MDQTATNAKQGTNDQSGTHRPALPQVNRLSRVSQPASEHPADLPLYHATIYGIRRTCHVTGVDGNGMARCINIQPRNDLHPKVIAIHVLTLFVDELNEVK